MSKWFWKVSLLFVVLAMVVSGCTPAASQGGAATEKPAVEPTSVPQAAAVNSAAPEPTAVIAAAKEPTSLKIVALAPNTVEDPWAQSLIQSAERVKAEKYHGLDISFEFVENVGFADIERVAREYIKSGKYGLVMFHTNYLDAFKTLSAEFPNQLMSLVNSNTDGYTPGTNAFWLDASPVGESSYLAGVVAALKTKSNTLGVVGSYPVDSINLPVNAFIEGAKYINPDIKVKVSFIESWYDPAKAREAAETQINAGADVIFSVVYGPFEACSKHKVFGIGIYVDQTSLAPDVVLTSPVAKWDPRIKYMIDQWWENQVNGTPYKSPEGLVTYSLKDGGNDIGPLNENLVSADIKAKVDEIRQQIVDGKIVVKPNIAAPKAD